MVDLTRSSAWTARPNHAGRTCHCLSGHFRWLVRVSPNRRRPGRQRAALIVDHQDGKVLGPRFVRLLEEIDAKGSVSRATATVGLGYRHAINWIRHAESVLGYALVVRRAGGAAGGGSGLTAEGVALVRSYRRESRVIDRIVRRAETEILGGPA